MAYPAYETYTLTSDRAVLTVDRVGGDTTIYVAVDDDNGSPRPANWGRITLSKDQVAALSKQLAAGVGE